MQWTTRAGRGRLGWRASAVTLAATALVAAGCGGLSGSGQQASAGSLSQSGINLSGQTYNVGGKNFDEQLFLCKAQIAALQSVGATVNDRCNIPGSAAARTAITSGQVDMYWSYTGTGWVVDLKKTPPIQDSQQQYQAVKDADLANGIVWTDPTPFNNTYAIGTTKAFAQQNNLKTSTDFANFVNSGNPEATLCVESEFAVRPDSLPGFKQTYGIGPDKLNGPPTRSTLDTGAIYQATANGNPCKFGEIFTTDGRIPGLNLVPLEDDKNYFPKYNASNTIRKEVVDRNPGVVQVSNEIAKRLDYQTMLNLNGQISSQGQDPDKVARDWLKQQGLIGQ